MYFNATIAPNCTVMVLKSKMNQVSTFYYYVSLYGPYSKTQPTKTDDCVCNQGRGFNCYKE